MRPCEEWTIGRNDGGRAWGPDDCVSVCCRQWSPLCFVSLSFCSLAFLLFTRSPSLTFISTNTCAFVWNCTITVGVSSYEAQVPLTFFFSAFFSCGFNGELDFIYFICSLLGSLIKISICYSLVSSLAANSNSLHPYITSWVHPAGHWDLSYTSVWVNVITSKRWSLGFKLWWGCISVSFTLCCPPPAPVSFTKTTFLSSFLQRKSKLLTVWVFVIVTWDLWNSGCGWIVGLKSFRVWQQSRLMLILSNSNYCIVLSSYCSTE